MKITVRREWMDSGYPLGWQWRAKIVGPGNRLWFVVGEAWRDVLDYALRLAQSVA